MKTDIEVLHEVYEAMNIGKPLPRGCGKTLVLCHIVAGNVELGADRIICLIPRMDWRKFITTMLIEVFMEHGLNLVKGVAGVLNCGSTIVEFRRKDDLRWQLGLSVATHIVDFDDR